MRCFAWNLGGFAARTLAVVGIAAALATSSAALDFQTVDFSSHHNYRLQNMDGNAGQLPSGSLLTGDGVPFYIPAGPGNNAYLSAQPVGGGQRMLDVSIGIQGVVKAFTLINTWWGTRSETAYAYLEFFGSQGAYYRRNLVGNQDIRDYLNSDYTNTINGSSTKNAVLKGQGKYWEVRLDCQEIVLPDAFRTQSLQSMRLVDNGDMGFQRTFLSGLTVGIQTVPEPSGLAVLLAGGLAFLKRRKSA